MKFKNIKIEKKQKISDLLDFNNYLTFLLLIGLVSFAFLVILFVFFYMSASAEIKKVMDFIFYYIGIAILILMSLFIVLFFIFLLYTWIASSIKGLLKSRYLPITEDEMNKLNIHNLSDYLEFIDDFMKEKLLCYGQYHYKLYLTDELLQFLNELAKKDYNQEMIFIRSNIIDGCDFKRFCLFRSNNKIHLYLAFRNDNTSHQKGNYDISYDYNPDTEEILCCK